ncbi:MAG: hypothetical protein GY714_12865 [Desulfobacterales bacterium]|nr:hypothetical protein [Desulfobacterales bacterium]MCP4159494.1 hypothetical protein [Deltaproteobacteria bacterium]
MKIDIRLSLKYILLLSFVFLIGCLKPNIFFDEDDIKEVRIVNLSLGNL